MTSNVSDFRSESAQKDPPKEVFVFGTDLAGRHTSGDALVALREYGAQYGRAVGLQGRSYAIPVRNEEGMPLPLPVIGRYVEAFLRFATIYRQTTFLVTRVGCGRGAYRDEDIAPLFANAPPNCRLPRSWLRYLAERKRE